MDVSNRKDWVGKTCHVIGLEPWSSGYGRRLTLKGHVFESWHRILDGHDIFSHQAVVKIVMMFD